MKAIVTWAVKGTFFLAVCIVWLVVGTLYWLAALARVLTVFAYAHLHAMFTDQDPGRLNDRVERTIDLWFRGFSNAHGMLYGQPIERKPLEVKASQLLSEGMWTIAFLLVVAALLKPDVAILVIREVAAALSGALSDVLVAFTDAHWGWQTIVYLIICAVVLIVGYSAGVVVRPPKQDEIEAQKALGELTKQTNLEAAKLDQLRTEVGTLEQRITCLQKDTQTKEQHLAVLSSRTTDQEGALTRLKTEITHDKAHLKETEDSIDEAKVRLRRITNKLIRQSKADS